MAIDLPKLSAIEATALKAWIGTHDENNVLPFRLVHERSGLPMHQVRRATRALARKGYVELTTAFNDEGLVGKGYMPTAAGQTVIDGSVSR